MEVVEAPSTFDELRNVVYGRTLKPLVRYLGDEVHHQAVVSALL